MSAACSQSTFDGSEIAVCGMAGRFPGAADLNTFWDNLRRGVESISRFSEQQLLAAGEDPQRIKDPDYVPARAVLDGVELFDAAFFGVTPREAEILDPQQRLMLECAWEALENAGYDSARFAGAISVFAGASFSNYLVHNLYANRPVMESFGDFESTICNVSDSLATRVAYKLNLKGPCLAVQTFCSTSLVAVHLACQALLNLECDLALAGGVTVYVPQHSGYRYQPGGIVSRDGRCRPFSAEAGGTVFGNGVGLVALRRLEDALSSGDCIHAVIRGTATNNDGSLKVSYAAPGVVGQTEVVIEALAAAGVDPATIGYIEAHGTGTKLGDPVEFRALTKALGARADGCSCWIGSVKGNVGHLDAAAGACGLIKTVLALEHGQIPPSLHCEQTNPEIDFSASPFRVATRLEPWPNSGGPRRAGVSAFGIGGTNAHVVLEEGPAAEPGGASRPRQLLLLSARTREALDRTGRNLAAHLRSHAELNLADVAYTLQVGRREFGHRRVIVCGDHASAITALETGDADPTLTVHPEQRDPPVVFMFPGHAAGLTGLTTALSAEPAFREHLERCWGILRPHLGAGVTAALAAGAGPADGARGLPAEPALLAVEYALAQLWITWGVRPQAVIGDGVGELAAACVAGALSLEDALHLAVDRVRQPAELSGGVVPGKAGCRPSCSTPQIPWISGRTATWITTEQAVDAHLWTAGGQSPRFGDAAALLIGEGKKVFLEVGPAGRCAAWVRECTACSPDCTVVGSAPQAGGNGAEISAVLEALGRLWLAGVGVNWPAFYAHEKRRRVPLPSYPFERQRFWVEPFEEPPPSQRLLEKQPDPSLWLYHPEWCSALRPAAPRSTGPGRGFLLWIDSTGVAAGVRDRLRAAGADVVTVAPGRDFGGDRQRGYTLDPGRREHYAALLAALRSAGCYPRIIGHFWSVPPPPAGIGAERFNACCAVGFDSLVHLVRALADHASDPVVLKVVATGLHDVLGQEALAPEKSPILALCKVAPQEHSHIRCCSIDIEDPGSGRGLSGDLLDQLAAEMSAGVTHNSIAYRGMKRWIETFDLLRGGGGPQRLRPGGVYLVTGGLGEVGCVMAAHLARTVQAKLVLTARSGLPPERQWGDELRPPGGDETGRRIRRVRALQELGAEVWVAPADAADGAAMRTVVGETRRRFGALHGVIHAAGVLAQDTFLPIRDLTAAACQAQFRPKVHGLYALEQALQGVQVDFCMLVSSLSSVLGGLGYAAYAAANTFMDAFAADRNRRGGPPWISVDWDQWQFGGAAPDAPANKSALARMAMTPQEGAAVFERILGLPDARRVVVSIASLHVRVAMWVQQIDAGKGGDNAARAAPARHGRPPELEASFVAPATDTERALAEIWQESLGVDRIGSQDNFFDLGGHSLLTIQVIDKVRQRLGLSVKVEEFIFQTLGQMAAACERQRRDQPEGDSRGRKRGLLGAVRQVLHGREERKP